MNHSKLAQIMREEGLWKSASAHPKDWRPDPLLQSRLEYGADMENPVSSFFETVNGTYTHEPSDGDAILFSPKGSPRKFITLGRGNFNTARSLAIKHHDSFSSFQVPTDFPKSYRRQLAESLALRKSKPRIKKTKMGQDGGWMDFPNGSVLQFDLRGYDSPLILVMEAMPEDEDALFADDSVDLPISGDLKIDGDAVFEQLMNFARKHRSILGT